MSYEIIPHIAATLRALGCEYNISFQGRQYSSQKTKQNSSKFKWEEDVFDLMKSVAVGDEVVFRIDTQWEPRKIQSFRTAVRNHAIRHWGVNGFSTVYDKEEGTIVVSRSDILPADADTGGPEA